MTPNDSIDTILRNWLTAEAPATEPADLHRSAIDAAGGRRQRPGWLVGLRSGAIGGPIRFVARPGVRLSYVLLVVLLILAILAIAIVGARLLRVAPPPFGRNGLIAYTTSDLAGRPYGHVHLMTADGRGDRTIGQGTCPSYSQDGSVLAFADTVDRTGLGARWTVWIAGDEGLAPRVVPGVAATFPLALSPDGGRIAWLKEPPELWVSPVAGGEAQLLVPKEFAPGEWLVSPLWSPDGESIAFRGMTEMANTETSGLYRYSIYVVEADGSNPRRLTSRPGTNMATAAMAWSPDSRYIAFLGVGEGKPAPSLVPGSGAQPAFSPPQDVFIISADGGPETALTATADDEQQLAWSPDGLHLAHTTFVADLGAWRLASIPMSGAASTGPRVLGMDAWPLEPRFTWSPDATRLLGVSYEGADFRQTEPPTTVWWVPADLKEHRATLPVANGSIGFCGPSWQRLAP